MKPTTLKYHPGARLHWHAARIRAEQLSQPKRKPVAATSGPTAEQLEQMAANGFAEGSCRLCGYGVCACCPRCERPQRGGMGTCACAPQPTKALDTPPTPAPGDPWAPGKRVRCIEGSLALPRGSEHIIASVERDSNGRLYLVLEGYENLGSWLAYRFEPVDAPPSKAPEQQAGEWVPPKPWLEREPQNYHHAPRDLWVWLGEATGKWRFAKGVGMEPVADVYDSLALAMCAALGIDLRPFGSLVTAIHPSSIFALAAHYDAEACARLALEAHAKAGAR
jgi:hypothetical protein